jgi:diguanylate cyclase (GGDEF)-like protein/putative nucleotidyltransferase with HDIG domain
MCLGHAMNKMLSDKNKLFLAKLWPAWLLLAVPALWLPFLYFGAAFAFVLAPLIFASGYYYRRHLKRQLAEKTQEISDGSRIHLATVEALATAIDARDQVGVGHVRRTQIYAVGIGRVLGLPENEIDALRTGALLHDIGKLAVPDHILNKAGGLTDAEQEKVKIHAEVGASILEKVSFDYPVVPTVRYHHEAWDGSGYPKGLKGKEIPLTARILSVADAFDTLRGERPYRPAWTREKARQTIQEQAGTKYDPMVVSTLIRHLVSLEKEIIAGGFAYTEANNKPAVEKSHFVEQIKSANREVFSLYELAREFSSSADQHETLELFSAKVGEFVPFDTCVVYLLDENKNSASVAHVSGLNAEVIQHHTIKVGQGATGFALKFRIGVRNVEPDLDFFYTQLELTQTYSTMASIPLIADEELIGAVTIYSCELESYGEEHIRLLETLARIAADAIDKSIEHDEAKTNALTDPMTGLPNARSLQTQFEREVARANRAKSSFQMLMLDLDGFKAVNDSFGHKAGDRLLKEISQVILEQLREYDFLARYGGDEFVALIPESVPEDVAELSKRIEAAVAAFELQVGENRVAKVGVSLGSASFERYGGNFDDMVAAADKAMYLRKTLRKQTATPAAYPKSIAVPADPLDDNLIVELDDTHILNLMSVN